MTDELPEGWVQIALQEVGRWQSGGTPSRRNPEYFGGEVPWIKSGDLPDGPVLVTEETITQAGLRNSAAKVMPAGTISMALYGATIGKLGLMTFPSATNQACANVVPHVQLVDTPYLFYFLLSERKNFIELGQGGAQPNISQEIVRNHPFRLAPLAEQRRIADKLEKLLAEVEQCKERMTKIPVLLKRFRQSVLAAACSGRLTADWREDHFKQGNAEKIVGRLETAHDMAGGHKRGNAAPPTDDVHDLDVGNFPAGWCITDLKTAVRPDRPITYGILKPGPNIPGGIAYVRVADFPGDRLDLGNIRRTSREIDRQYARARLRAGDILLSIRGTVGRVCRVPQELENANITQDTARLTIQDQLNPAFVMWFLRAPETQKRMQRAIKGVAIRGINIGDVRALQLPVPSIDEQNEIVRRVESLLSIADSLETRYEIANARVQSITQSVLAVAFRGGLVPTEAELAEREGRNYESAARLLERVRAARIEPVTDRTNETARTRRHVQ